MGSRPCFAVSSSLVSSTCSCANRSSGSQSPCVWLLGTAAGPNLLGSGVETMCGIAGILLPPTANPLRLSAIEPMTGTLRHRGPDGHRSWVDREGMVALGHRRLAIVDLSDAGAQPMLSSDKSLVMTFNGEVYNFADLRPALAAKGYSFRGSSDTEVMLAAFES